jgi:microcystin-dependent protein
MGFFSSYSGNNKKAVNVEFVLKMLDRLIPPIGFIYMSASYNNPSAIYPNTVWTEWGKGRVPVGVDVSQTEFNTVEKTGGEKTHTLVAKEMPSHSHSYSGSISVSGTTDTTGAHSHTVETSRERNAVPERDPNDVDGCRNTTATTSTAGNHSHTISANGSYSGDTSSVGSGSDHNNLQPYITCYMWKRTG